MSLIDESYFTGSLTIPQLGQGAVIDNLDNFIQVHEPLFLQAALGYALWEDFVNGLMAPVIDQKWLDLRDGARFVANGMWPPFIWQNSYMNTSRDWFIPQNPMRPMRWVGFCGGQPTAGSNNSLGSIKVLVVQASADDPLTAPVANTKIATIPLLANTVYTIERRGFGTMIQDVDVDVSNAGQTITLLKPGDVFALGEIFILHFSVRPSSGTPTMQYVSPLAAYVYYEFMRDQAGNLSAFGVVTGKSENSSPALPMLKMADAFNVFMSAEILKLWSFLELKGITVYPSYDRLMIDYMFFKPINKYGI